jgi:hypothetical protein
LLLFCLFVCVCLFVITYIFLGSQIRSGFSKSRSLNGRGLISTNIIKPESQIREDNGRRVTNIIQRWCYEIIGIKFKGGNSYFSERITQGCKNRIPCFRQNKHKKWSYKQVKTRPYKHLFKNSYKIVKRREIFPEPIFPLKDIDGDGIPPFFQSDNSRKPPCGTLPWCVILFS